MVVNGVLPIGSILVYASSFYLPATPIEPAFLRILPNRDPEMQMNSYNMNALLFSIQSAGVSNLYVECTDHEGKLGVFLFFQKACK
jgi:hypothetical protein